MGSARHDASALDALADEVSGVVVPANHPGMLDALVPATVIKRLGVVLSSITVHGRRTGISRTPQRISIELSL